MCSSYVIKKLEHSKKYVKPVGLILKSFYLEFLLKVSIYPYSSYEFEIWLRRILKILLVLLKAGKQRIRYSRILLIRHYYNPEDVGLVECLGNWIIVKRTQDFSQKISSWFPKNCPALRGIIGDVYLSKSCISEFYYREVNFYSLCMLKSKRKLCSSFLETKREAFDFMA